jgi:hypothetical protein
MGEVSHVVLFSTTAVGMVVGVDLLVLELCNPSAVIPLVRAIPVVMSQSSWRRARILEWLLKVLVVEVRKEGAPPSRTTPWNELD